MRLISAGILTLASLVCGAANAANLADVYEAAVINDPQLGAAKHNFAARKEVVPQSRAGLLPVASVGAFKTWNEREFPSTSIPTDNFDEKGWQAQVSQPLFDAEAYFTYRGAKDRAE